MFPTLGRTRGLDKQMISSCKAFSLLEILIAIMIFTVGIISILSLLNMGLFGDLDAENTSTALALTQQRLEEIRNLAFDAGIVNESKAPVAGFSGFQREVIVTQPQTDLKQVTVTTYWTAKANEVGASLVTYISKN